MLIPVTASLYDWLLLLHIMAAMVWVGGLVDHEAGLKPGAR